MLNRFVTAADEAARAHGGSIDRHIGDAVMAVFGAAGSVSPKRPGSRMGADENGL